VYKFILLILCVQIYICILLAFVKLLCHFLFVFVWRHCNGRRKQLASKFKDFAGISPTANKSFNMKTCRAIWRFITKNELYGFIILYKTINVIMVFIVTLCQFSVISGHNRDEMAELILQTDDRNSQIWLDVWKHYHLRWVRELKRTRDSSVMLVVRITVK